MASNVNLDEGPPLQFFCKVVDWVQTKQLTKVVKVVLHWSLDLELYCKTVFSNELDVLFFFFLFLLQAVVRFLNKRFLFRTEFIDVHNIFRVRYFWDTFGSLLMLA